MFTGSHGIATKLPHGVEAAALVVSLVLSAYLTAVALQTPEHHWLAWISFLPLFVAVRSLRPLAAVLSGALWGSCLYVFFVTGPAPTVEAMTPAIAPSVWLLALLIVIPAVYVGLAALPTRAIGFKLLTLALGWTLIEVVLLVAFPTNPESQASTRAAFPCQHHTDSIMNGFGLRQRPLTGSQGEDPHLHWLARLLGYVSTAFLVACANSSLVGLLCSARVSIPRQRSFAIARLRHLGACRSSQTTLCLQLLALRQTYPRAPPPAEVVART